MPRKALPSLLVITVLLLSGAAYSGEGSLLTPLVPIRYAAAPSAGDLQTALRSDHQGDHEITECAATLKENTLTLVFPMNPAYHLEIHLMVQIKERGFSSRLLWTPVTPHAADVAVETQSLILEKRDYKPGDTVNGYLDITFTAKLSRIMAQDPPSPGQAQSPSVSTYYVRGPFSSVIHAEGFDPLADAAVKNYTQDDSAQEGAVPRAAANGQDGKFAQMQNTSLVHLVIFAAAY